MPARSSLASRLKAFSPPQLALVALGSLALAGAGTAAAAGLLAGAVARDRSIDGGSHQLIAGEQIAGDDERYRVRAPKVDDAQDQSLADRDDAPAKDHGPRDDRAAASSGSGSAPAPSGGAGTSGAGGPEGNTGGAGPKGDTGGAGPKGNTGGGGPKTDGSAGAGPSTDGIAGPGPNGDARPDGSAAAPRPIVDTVLPAPQATPDGVPVPAVLVVKDAKGMTAGMLTNADPNAAVLGFLFKDRLFAANAQTGALELPTVETSYATDGCTGTPYALINRPATSVLRSANVNETGIYEFGQPRSLEVRSIWQPGQGCLPYVYSTEIAPLRELSAGELPPTLNGPLRAVAAG